VFADGRKRTPANTRKRASAIREGKVSVKKARIIAGELNIE